MATRSCIILNIIITLASAILCSSVLRFELLLEFRNTFVRRLGAENPASSPSLNHPYLMDVFFSVQTLNQ